MKKHQIALFSIISIFIVIVLLQVFEYQKLDSRERPQQLLFKNNVLPTNFKPIDLKTSQQKKSSQPLKGQWIKVNSLWGQMPASYSIIFTPDKETIQGSLNELKKTQFFLPDEFPENWDVTIYAKKHMVWSKTVGMLRRDPTVKLLRTASISGTVTKNNKAISSGTIQLRALNKENEVLAKRLFLTGLIPYRAYQFENICKSQTVDNGRFELEDIIFKGVYEITAEAPLAAAASRRVIVRDPGQKIHVAIPLKLGWTIKGRFIDPSDTFKPHQINLSVYREPTQRGRLQKVDIYCQTELNSKGGFSFSGEHAGTYKLVFSHWGKGVGLIKSYFVAVEETKLYDIGEIFAPPAKVYGRVLDRQGYPIENVTIWGGGTSPDDVMTLPHYECSTDANGTIRLHIEKWSRLSAHIKKETIPSHYVLDRQRTSAEQFLEKGNSEFQFILKRAPSPLHFVFPPRINLQGAHIFTKRNQQGYFQSSISVLEENGNRIFKFSGIESGIYEVYFQETLQSATKDNWFGTVVTIPENTGATPIKFNLSEANRLQTVTYQIELTGDLDCRVLFKAFSKDKFVAIHQQRAQEYFEIKRPSGMPLIMSTPGRFLDGKIAIDLPKQGGLIKFHLTKSE